MLYKKVNNKLRNRDKNIFQEAKKLFDLRFEIYKKFVLEEENLKFEKSIGGTGELNNQKDILSETLGQKEFNNFLEQIKEEQNNIDMNLSKNVFNYKTPDEMLEYLHSLKRTDDYNQETFLIEKSFTDFKDEVEIMSKKQGNKNIEYC